MQSRPLCPALYAISVRRLRTLPTASFRFYLSVDTLAVRLTLPTTKRVVDFHHQAIAHGGRTKQKSLILPVKSRTIWSEWRDSNSRPLEPHSSTLPSCATPRLTITRQAESIISHHQDLSTLFTQILVSIRIMYAPRRSGADEGFPLRINPLFPGVLQACLPSAS